MNSLSSSIFKVLWKILFKKKNSKKFENQCKILENEARSIFFIANKQGQVKFVERDSDKVLGYRINKKLEFIFFEIYGHYIKSLFLKPVEVLEQNPPYIEFPMRNLVGKYIWIRLTFLLKRLENEPFVVVTAENASKQRELFEEFEEKKIWSTSIIDNLNIGLLMENEQREIMLVNRYIFKLFPFIEEYSQIIGQSSMLFHEKLAINSLDQQAFIKQVETIVRMNTEVGEEVVMFQNNKIFARSYIPLHSKNGKHLHVWLYKDISESYHIQDLVRRSEEKHRGILENMQLGVVEIASNGTIIKPSNYFCSMAGYTACQLEGTKITDILLFSEEQKKIFFSLGENKLPSNEAPNSQAEVQLKRGNGNFMWVLVTTSVIFDKNNKPTGVVFFFYDMTTRKELELALNQANEAAIKAEESERLFTASMTHELKTPINAIVGMSDLLKLTTLDEEQKEYVQILETSTKYLQKLVSDVLDLSKIESGHIEIKKETFVLRDLLIDIVRTFDYNLAKNDVELKLHFDFKSNLVVYGDKMILQQIISNLLSNAEKFTQKGSITLNVELLEETNGQVKIHFSVSDTGVGIDKDMLGVIFEKFKQLPALNVHKAQGTGLGLTIVKQLLEILNSKIEVQSEKGKGSTFSFALYFDKVTKIEKTKPKPISSKIKEGFSELKILVVEDNELNQQYVAKVLNKWEISHKMVISGEDALICFEKEKFDIILMDIQLPGMSGLDTALELRKRYTSEIFEVIAMTAVVTSDIERDILKYGMNDIIRKPFSIAELQEKLLFYSSELKSKQSKNSIFLNELDIEFLNEFYGEDKTYALEVFSKFSTEYWPIFKQYVFGQHELSMEELKRKLHGMKPSFKMVGLSMFEEKIGDYIHNNKATEALGIIFTEKEIIASEELLNKQIERLKR